jgi:putative oxidoreductase
MEHVWDRSSMPDGTRYRRHGPPRGRGPGARDLEERRTSGFVAAHGPRKRCRFRRGGGLAASTEQVRGDGPAGSGLTALLAGLTQVGAGALLTVGLLTPTAAVGAVDTMTVAVTVTLPKGLWSRLDGYEYAAPLALLAVALAWTGPGRHALDRAAGIACHWTAWVSAGATVRGVGAALTRRVAPRRPVTTAGRLA